MEAALLHWPALRISASAQPDNRMSLLTKKAHTEAWEVQEVNHTHLRMTSAEVMGAEQPSISDAESSEHRTQLLNSRICRDVLPWLSPAGGPIT